MDVKNVGNLNKEQLLYLFHKKDFSNKGEKREFFSSVFYDFIAWPSASLRDFWLLRYVNRLRLTNFCYGNGMNQGTLLDMLSFYHTHNDDNIRRWKEISDLWNRLQNEILPDYYYFSMHYGFEIYFTGNKRVNGKPAGPVVEGPMFNSQSRKEPTLYLKPKMYEKMVREQVIEAENEKAMERKKIRENLEKARKESIKQKEVLMHLQLNSIDELHELFLESPIANEKNK